LTLTRALDVCSGFQGFGADSQGSGSFVQNFVRKHGGRFETRFESCFEPRSEHTVTKDMRVHVHVHLFLFVHLFIKNTG